MPSPFFVDVITCAAPFFSGSGYSLPYGDLQRVYERRIRNIFEVAIEHQIEVIILGPFGCGAFPYINNNGNEALKRVWDSTASRE